MPPNLTVLTLLPYSPASKPVEQLWRDLRQRHWSNRVYPMMADLEDAAVEGWRAACLNAEQIKTVRRCDYSHTRFWEPYQCQ